MKKIVFILCLIGILAVSSTCFAKVGDKVGNIYATDIKTYINDIPVQAYNIGGRTCVPIEDVTMGYAYNNDYITLLVTSFEPSLLKEYKSKSSSVQVGKIVGSIYSTDIKTYFYDQELQAYNIGGKTCVAVEDLGSDNSFSNIGGKYVWSQQTRTLKLEFMYDNKHELGDVQNQYKYRITIVGTKDASTYTYGNVSFVPVLTDAAWITTDFSEIINTYSERPNNIIPLVYWENGVGTTIGYNFSSDNKYFIYDDSGKANLEEMLFSFNYFYIDKVEDILKNKGNPNKTRTEVIDEHINTWMADTFERYDTDDYTFLFLYQPTPHGRNSLLLYVRSDGSFEYVHDMLPDAGEFTRAYDKVYINEEEETVTIEVSGVEGEYIFDLRTGKMR